jgi:dTDP-4-dehydrorhamnose reductase
MRIAITGAGGMLGTDVREAAAQNGLEVVALSHAELDITDQDAVRRVLTEARPEVVLNLAAYTNVDGAEREREAAFAVNGAGAGHVARAATECGAWTIHVSSDYVFDGTKTAPYIESDPTNPLSVYGASKLAGEHRVADEAPNSHTTVRSSWLFGLHGPCFPATMLRLASERDTLTVVDDQVGCPTFTPHLAAALLTIARDPALRTDLTGVVHVAAAGQCSWYQFARAIFASARLDTEVVPGLTTDLARPATRPAYSVMRSERGSLVPLLPDWWQGLDAYMVGRVSAA